LEQLKVTAIVGIWLLPEKIIKKTQMKGGSDWINEKVDSRVLI
jgi:hypothetical protein